MQTKKLILIIIGVAFLMRIPFLLFVSGNPRAPYTSHDSFGYDAIARNILENGSFSIYPQDPQVKDPVRTPGYPFFLAAVYGIFPNTAFFVVLLQMALDIGIVILLFFFGKALVNRTAGVIAALLYALNIHQILFATQILTELLFTTILLLALFSFLLFLKNGRGRILFSSALCFGIAIMIRPIALLLPVIPLVFLAKQKVALRLIMLFALIVIIFPISWTIRNSIVFKQFFFTKIQSVNLVLYHAPAIIADVEEITRSEAIEVFFEAAKEKYGLTDYDIDYFDDNPSLSNTLAREARGIVSAYPMLFLKHHCIGTIKTMVPLNVGFSADILEGRGAGGVGLKPIFSSFWHLLLRGRIGQALILLRTERLKRLNPGVVLLFIFMVLYQTGLYVFAVMGLKKYRIPGVTIFLLLVIAYFILIPGVVGEARFRVPVEPVLAFMAAMGVVGRRGS